MAGRDLEDGLGTGDRDPDADRQVLDLAGALSLPPLPVLSIFCFILSLCNPPATAG